MTQDPLTSPADAEPCRGVLLLEELVEREEVLDEGLGRHHRGSGQLLYGLLPGLGEPGGHEVPGEVR